MTRRRKSLGKQTDGFRRTYILLRRLEVRSVLQTAICFQVLVYAHRSLTHMSASLSPLFLSSLSVSFSVCVCVNVCAQNNRWYSGSKLAALAAKEYCWLWQLCPSFWVSYILSVILQRRKLKLPLIFMEIGAWKRKREVEKTYWQNCLLFLYPCALLGCHFTLSLASCNEFGWCSFCYWQRSHCAPVGLAFIALLLVESIVAFEQDDCSSSVFFWGSGLHAVVMMGCTS